jgi:hypothetical protein
LCQRSLYFSLQQRKIVRHRLPNGLQFYPVVLMAEPVSHTTDIPPPHAPNPALGFGAEPDRSLADDLQLALDSGNRFRVFAKGPRSIPETKRSIIPTASIMSRSDLSASLMTTG